MPRRTGNAHPNITPYDTFATGSEPIFLAVGNDKQFATLCRVLDATELAGRRALRRQRPALHPPHGTQGRCSKPSWPRTNASRWPMRWCALACPARRSRTWPPRWQTRTRCTARWWCDIGEGYRGVASPIKLSRTPATYRLPPPAFDKGA